MGAIYIVGWLIRSGMEYAVVLLFLFATFVVYVGLARIVSDVGLIYAQASVTPQAVTVNVLGSSAMSGASLTALAMSYTMIDYMRGLFMPSLAQVAKLSDFIRSNRRKLLSAVAAGVVVGLVASVAYTLYLGYSVGAGMRPSPCWRWPY